jgi:hypothetical protein
MLLRRCVTHGLQTAACEPDAKVVHKGAVQATSSVSCMCLLLGPCCYDLPLFVQNVSLLTFDS